MAWRFRRQFFGRLLSQRLVHYCHYCVHSPKIATVVEHPKRNPSGTLPQNLAPNLDHIPLQFCSLVSQALKSHDEVRALGLLYEVGLHHSHAMPWSSAEFCRRRHQLKKWLSLSCSRKAFACRRAVSGSLCSVLSVLTKIDTHRCWVFFPRASNFQPCPC